MVCEDRGWRESWDGGAGCIHTTISRMKRDWIHVERRPSGLCVAALVIFLYLEAMEYEQDPSSFTRARLEDGCY